VSEISAAATLPDAASHLVSKLRPEIRAWCEAWKGCLQTVLSQVAGQPHLFEISSEPPPAAASDIWYTVVAGAALRGEMVLRLSANSGTRLAQKFLGEAGVPAAVVEITSDNKEALEELLRQIAGLTATAVGAIAGGEVKLSLTAAPTAPSWTSDAIICLQTRDETGESLAVEIQISPALAAELQSRAQAMASTSQTVAPAPAQSSAPAPDPSTPPLASYRRLMDVGLDVKLRFGSRRMLLRDVLALSAGVVVELENTLHSPVDLLLDGRLIAQGEVVIVDGKYGLRITGVVETAATVGAPL
jgi:flagellar motor switch protein FliN/FliY